MVSLLDQRSYAELGVIGTKTPRVRNLRILKKEVLKLVENYISKSEDKYVVMGDCIPPLLEAVLLDYQSNHEQARDAEVLNVMASIVNKMGVHSLPLTLKKYVQKLTGKDSLS